MSTSQNVSSNTLTGPGQEGSSAQTNPARSSISEQELVERCLNVVENYKHALISKQEAFVTITKAIASASDEAMDQAESFIATPYFEMLEEWSRDLDLARGQRGPDVMRRSEDRESFPPVSDALNSHLVEVNSPQILRAPTKSSSTGLKIPKKYDVNSCITAAAPNSMKLDGQRSLH